MWKSLRGCRATSVTLTFLVCLSLLLPSGNREDGKFQVLATCVEVLKGSQSFPGDLEFSFLSFSSSRSWPRVWKSLRGCRASPGPARRRPSTYFGPLVPQSVALSAFNPRRAGGGERATGKTRYRQKPATGGGGEEGDGRGGGEGAGPGPSRRPRFNGGR